MLTILHVSLEGLALTDALHAGQLGDDSAAVKRLAGDRLTVRCGRFRTSFLDCSELRVLDRTTALI